MTAAFAQSLLLVLSPSLQTIFRFPPLLETSRLIQRPTLRSPNIALHMVMECCKFERLQMCLGPARTRRLSYPESRSLHWKKLRPLRCPQTDRCLQILLRTILRRLSLQRPRAGGARVLLSQRDLKRILEIMMTRHRFRPQMQHPCEVPPQFLCHRRQLLYPEPNRVSSMTLLLLSIRAPIR